MSPFDPCPDVLEVTLRDGSYLIDFQFTAEDTALVAAALEQVGFRWIEVGHGLGLNASASGKGKAAASDEEYLAAAAQALRQARWGMFFIPGIGRAEDLRLAARYRMSFVRIGTNITEVAQARPFIELAKELGFFVSFNAMKTYAVSPAEFARHTAEARRWGADLACVVDSAGGMVPEDVEAYFTAARAASDVPLGFHGHDNLSLAMANTLRAVECGAVLVDSSLQGVGRSAGNAATEALVAVLKRRGHLQHLDLNAVLDVGQGLIGPALRRRGLDPLAVTAGFARFHTAFTDKVQAYAHRHGRDVRDLIVRLCSEDQVDAPDALLERLSQEVAPARPPCVVCVPAFAGRERRETGTAALRAVLGELRPQAVKAGKFSALNVVMASAPLPEPAVSWNIQSTPAHVVGSVAFSTAGQLAEVLSVADGTVDVVLLDVDRKPFGPAAPAREARRLLTKSLLLTYSDSRVWIQAAEEQVVRLVGEVLDEVPLVVAGDHPRSRSLALGLAERGGRVTVLAGPDEQPSAPGRAAFEHLAQGPHRLGLTWLAAGEGRAEECLAEARVVVVWPAEAPWFGVREMGRVRPGTHVLDSRIAAILPEGLEEGRRRGVLLLRLNIWPVLAAALSGAHESAHVCRDALGWEELAGVPVVAGGAMGRCGDVIVDSVRQPTRVIGLADGRGGVLFDYPPEGRERVRRVMEEINRRLLAPRLHP